MAIASKTTVERKVSSVEKVQVVNLELTIDEARAVSAVLAHVSGVGPLRNDTAAVADALRKAGVNGTTRWSEIQGSVSVVDPAAKKSGGVTFASPTIDWSKASITMTGSRY